MKIAKTGMKNPKLSELNKLKLGDLNPSRRKEVKEKLSKSKVINMMSVNLFFFC